MSTLGGIRVSRIGLMVPKYGGSYGDATLEGGTPPTGKVTLVLADLTLTVSCVVSGYDAPDKPRVLISSGEGWGSKVSPKVYQSDPGVRLSTVLRDLAKSCGETIKASSLPTPDPILGRHWVRRGTIGRGVLADLVRRGYAPPWWVDVDGSTRFDARPAPTAKGKATITGKNTTRGVTYAAVDSAAAFMPGATLDGSVIARTVFHEHSSELTIEGWST